ncbi:hypothetical protein NE237_031510 [Protea cynaroides]|uniref:Retroviral polymerase SH3-like domain-containing protein n=1 Tax=Protea cynaroides TaxID=273540 RepID=A0A9Q0L1E2_9MAGN|nr:hypothetical protein NE237_031510 [Protea cynaroides]
MEINKRTNNKKISFKEEEEDEGATTQLLTEQRQQTSPILNVTGVIGMAITNQSAERICPKVERICPKDKLYNPSTKKIVISRNVVFDEDGMWLWNDNGVKEHTPSNFDSDENGHKVNVQEPEATQSLPAHAQSPIASEGDEEQIPSHVKRRPAWMVDYEVTGINQSETHFALFFDCDPTIFEEAVKESKWCKAMDDGAWQWMMKL